MDTAPSAEFVWEYVIAEDDRNDQLAAARRHGITQAQLLRLEASRFFSAQVYEARRDYVRHKAMAQLAANQDDMFELASLSEKLPDKLSVHGALSRLAEFDKPAQMQGASGGGFVLTINLPGNPPMQMAALNVVDMPEDLPPVPKYLESPDNPDIVTPLLNELEMA
ncbi:MAG: hypothetical protein M0R28_24380 [Pigmentiphaga sp.]|nr:hypothetical protein [Pigmentiphaga sp.]